MTLTSMSDREASVKLRSLVNRGSGCDTSTQFLLEQGFLTHLARAYSSNWSLQLSGSSPDTAPQTVELILYLTYYNMMDL